MGRYENVKRQNKRNYRDVKYLFVLIIVLFQFSNENVFAKNNILDRENLLTSNDIKIYKQIFSIQSKSILNKRNCNCSIEWRKVDKLIKKINNKILLGTVYSERYLHPTGWRSSYRDLKLWLDKYNDHPDAYRIFRIALKRKPKKFKISFKTFKRIFKRLWFI